MQKEVTDLIRIISSITGHDISKYDESFLLQTIKRRCELTQTEDVSRYLLFLEQAEEESQKFVLSLNNHYTDFFRNELVFAQLEHWIIPTLLEQMPENREFRVWSAGCSTGQEAYSLAILLENIAEKRRSAFRYRIIATDLSDSALAAAKQGEYNEEAIQNLRMKDLTLFFEQTSGIYRVTDRLKKYVSFSRYDLLDPSSVTPQESIFGNFDLVMCSNVLFYYNAVSQQFILKKLVNSVMETGCLITGEAERSSAGKTAGLIAVAPPSPIFKKRLEVRL